MNKVGQVCVFDVRIYSLLLEISQANSQLNSLYLSTRAVLKNRMESFFQIRPTESDYPSREYYIFYSNVAFWLMYSLSGLLSDLIVGEDVGFKIDKHGNNTLSQSIHVSRFSEILRNRPHRS